MKIALVGNQNSGKSTLFNTLTGDNQKIGNWPGVTIDKKIGRIKNTNFDIIDLPGIYSLIPYTREESVTATFVMNENVDIYLNIIDCNSISRGLYLTLQLLEKNKNVIVLLNMHDIAESKGIYIDEKKLEALLKIPVIKISATSEKGIKPLITYLNTVKIIKPLSTNFNIEKGKPFSTNFNTEKERTPITNLNTVNEKEKNNNNFNAKSITDKYKIIDEILAKSIIQRRIKRESLTDKIDRIILNKYLAFPIFVGIMLVIYYLAIEVVGNNTINIINNFFERVTTNLEEILFENNVSTILISLLTNGIIGGVSTVISFLPQLTILFIALGILEKIGYMTRITLIFDKLLKKLGMSGNSIIPFILGTGCSVPAIMAVRTIKNEEEKKITTVLTPFIPCSAKLPIISLFSAYFFKENAGMVAISFYILSIIVIILTAFLFRKFSAGHEKNYISELPEYRLPKITQILKDSIEKVIDFLKRAGSIILFSSIIVWFLLSFSTKLEYSTNIQESILANIGKTISWIFVPICGVNSWEITVSAIQGLIAKEQVISSMAIIADLETNNIASSIFANGSPFDFFTPVSAYSYVCFNLFCAPCFGAISAMKKNLGNINNVIKAVFFQIGVAYITSCVIFMIGSILF